MASTSYTTGKPARTIHRQVMRPVWVEMPVVITDATHHGEAGDALTVYYEIACERGVAPERETVTLVRDAMQAGDAICVTYSDEKGETTGRVLFPSAIGTAEKTGGMYVSAYCTLRRLTKCFRLDRMANAHLVTLPGEATDDEPVSDLITGPHDEAEARATYTTWDEHDAAIAAGVEG